MTEDQSVLKAANTAGIRNVREENETASVMPYYWSWYHLVFAGHEPRNSQRQAAAPREKQ